MVRGEGKRTVQVIDLWDDRLAKSSLDWHGLISITSLYQDKMKRARIRSLGPDVAATRKSNKRETNELTCNHRFSGMSSELA